MAGSGTVTLKIFWAPLTMPHIIKTISQWLWPTCCVLCHNLTQNDLAICDACKKELPWNIKACFQCGVSMEHLNSHSTHCGACIAKHPPFSKTIGLFTYQKPITQLITQLKFHQQLKHAQLLGGLLAHEILNKHPNRSLPDCIIPIPLHPKRLKERGYNQAVEIAKPISSLLNIPLDYKHCIRIKNTAAQSSLSAKDRRKNMNRAFALQAPLPYKHVAIVDDVITTGHTTTEFSRLLRKSGVEEIELWCCARALTTLLKMK